MEDIDVQKLSRKELLQLCAEHNIRTAGVKHDDLVRLLQKKLHPPASDPPRVTPKTRSQISTASPISSPQARNQTSGDSPFSSPITKEKPVERASLPTPGSTSLGRSLRPLVLLDDRSRNNLPEPAPRTPMKDQLSPNPGALPRKPTAKKSNSLPTPQRTDLLRKKVNTLTAIGQLQAQERAQERARPAQQNDGSSVRGHNNVVSAPIGKQSRETRPQLSDRSSSIRSRSGTAAIGSPKKNIKSTSMPVKRPGERTLGVKNNEASPKGQSSKPTASSPRASEGEASVAATAITHSDLGSHSYGSVSEIVTDGGHHAVWEDSDADDAQSVSSEPVSRFASQSERFHSPRTSAGSKLGRVTYPSLESAHGRRSSLDSSVESNAPLEKDSDPSGEESLISSYSLEDDAAFNLVGDAHGLDINSFLDAHSGSPLEINEAEGLHQVKSVREQDVAASETAPSIKQRNELGNSGNPRVKYDVPASDCRQDESSIAAVESSAPDKQFDSTLNLVHDEDTSEAGADSQGKNTQLVGERSATCSPSHQVSSNDSGVQLVEENDPTCCSGKDYTVTSAAECIEPVHFHLDSAPLPHPDMERSSVTPMSVNRTDLSPPPDSTAAELDLSAVKSSSPCDELQQDFDIKLEGGHGGSNLGPKHDYSKDRSKKSNLLQSDRSEKVPLLQDGRESENTHLVRRTFPSSILLWCSQLFSAIFGTRSQN